MTDRELMQQALDAFGGLLVFNPSPAEYKQGRDVVAALRERLAQPEQEPVAWAHRGDLQNFDMRVRTNGDPLHTVPLYTSHRQWVGLTEEDKAGFWTADQMTVEEWDTLFNEIEEALKEKNT